MDLSIIVVNYNGGEVLKNCLDSVIRETKQVNYELFVVDNNSTDGSVDEIRRLFPNTILMENGENLGFAKANNQAIKRSTGKYILLLNPDTVVLSGAIDKLKKFIERKLDAGAVCGKAFNADGTIQYTLGRFPTIANQIGDAISIHRFFPRLSFFQDRLRDDIYYQSERQVDWGIGAFLMLRREAIDQVGVLDEQFFMYAEERDLCFRLWQGGWAIYFDPMAEIIHFGQSRTVPELFAELKKSRIMFISKHYRGTSGWLMRNINISGIAFKLIIWSALRILPGVSEKAKIKSQACSLALQKVL